MAIPYPDHGLGHEPHGKPHIPVGPKGYGKDQYFQYINVPAHKVFEWGYRRGIDPHHFREEYLSQKDHTFKAKVSRLGGKSRLMGEDASKSVDHCLDQAGIHFK